ncbi:putative Neurogenic locus notch protein 1 [Paratrimastix pyriformis]|uniref:Neurogenic locus notch protein 1 n=1 Tax=Paratrimastix pyriformis TaxID=342808 RepID=A0ABQ8UH18_9EUKA|nr:putative Neurogenic locus notch protein 1 [Paratrimastix pyriformis]
MAQCAGMVRTELATIRDETENEVLQDILSNQDFWIGLTRDSLTAPFYWLDGDASAFRDWGPLQPESETNLVLMKVGHHSHLGWFVSPLNSSLEHALCRAPGYQAGQCSLDAICRAMGDVGATCVSGLCRCSPGRFGSVCEAECSQCIHGTCADSSCTCEPGWTGLGCNMEKNLTCAAPPLGANQVYISGCADGSPVGTMCTMGCASGFCVMPGSDLTTNCTKGGVCFGDSISLDCRRVHALTHARGCDLPDCGPEHPCEHGGVCDGATGECHCPPPSSGPFCENECTSDGDCPGHGDCEPDPEGHGHCTCAEGWHGSGCDLPDCGPEHPCEHGGVCDGATGECHCPPPSSGPFCENECTSDGDCPGHGDCEPDPEGHGHCTCAEGWHGSGCDLPDCGPEHPCEHGGVCDGATGECHCPPPSSGPFCENECTSDGDCPGHGDCEPDPEGHGHCTCAEGWHGSGCDLPDCGPEHPCEHGGVCDGATGECHCPPPSSGPFCENECTSDGDCPGHGDCEPDPEGHGHCTCAEGWHGSGCDLPDCGPEHPCEHGGVCDGATGECHCPPPSSGPFCENECTSDGDCPGHGDCEPDPEGHGHCTCAEGWHGSGCDLPDCGPEHPCEHGGVCDGATGECHCPPPSSGPFCENECTSDGDCPGHGDCEPDPEGHGHCTCAEGWHGSGCDLPDCGPEHPCEHGGRRRLPRPRGLRADPEGHGHCTCAEGWHGSGCDLPDCGPEHPCEHGGVCDGATGECHCPPPSSGPFCENECTSDGDCPGHGDCEPDPEGHGHCTCAEGWHGSGCDLPDCGPEHPCEHGGVCDGATGECHCPPPSSGPFCENECTSDGDCPGHGDCEPDPEGHGHCTCAEGWHGSGCDLPDCGPEHPCEHGGVCDGATGECHCPPPSSGPFCENECTSDGDCPGHGDCEPDPEGHGHCTCAEGWHGSGCDLPDCGPEHPCEHGGRRRLPRPRGLRADPEGHGHCTCAEGWHGSGCDLPDCGPEHPCEHGGVCDGATGECHCPPPSSGPFCENECTSDGDCPGHGDCEPDPEGHGHCTCAEGWHGSGCDLPDCGPEHPCEHGGVCDGATGECHCPPPSSGPFCENECTSDGDCPGHGDCEPDPEGHGHCTCAEGWHGSGCDLPDCGPEHPCEHGGRRRLPRPRGLRADPEGHGHCTCAEGWHGSGCDLPDCGPEHPCEHGGVCDGATGECHCPPPSSGPFCENECTSDGDCPGHGDCEPDPEGHGHCTCAEGWHGSGCDLPDCGPEHPCEHGGVCDGATGECHCPPPSSGPFCENECTSDGDCPGHGDCEPDPEGHGHCTCAEGWHGSGCDLPDCGPEHPCEHGGVCDGATGECHCPPPSSGPFCENECTSDGDCPGHGDCEPTRRATATAPARRAGTAAAATCPTAGPSTLRARRRLRRRDGRNECTSDGDCPGHGDCEPDPEGHGHCTCAEGWHGSGCDLPDCGPEHPCEHGGVCDGATGECHCPPPSSGPFCENECTSDGDCPGHGDCEPDPEGHGHCTCAEGWHGSGCDLPDCGPEHPCEHGGLDPADGHRRCVCDEGWHGTACDLPDALCQCVHGTCILQPSGEYTCLCYPGWDGPFCDVPPCPCLNGGLCQYDEHDALYCQCPDGWRGSYCEIPDCTNDDQCHNGGTCLPSGDCDCAPGYDGPWCDEHVGDCSEDADCSPGTCVGSPPDRVCSCPPGTSGTYCDQACPYDPTRCWSRDFSAATYTDASMNGDILHLLVHGFNLSAFVIAQGVPPAQPVAACWLAPLLCQPDPLSPCETEMSASVTLPQLLMCPDVTQSVVPSMTKSGTHHSLTQSGTTIEYVVPMHVLSKVTTGIDPNGDFVEGYRYQSMTLIIRQTASLDASTSVHVMHLVNYTGFEKGDSFFDHEGEQYVLHFSVWTNYPYIQAAPSLLGLTAPIDPTLISIDPNPAADHCDNPSRFCERAYVLTIHGQASTCLLRGVYAIGSMITCRDPDLCPSETTGLYQADYEIIPGDCHAYLVNITVEAQLWVELNGGTALAWGRPCTVMGQLFAQSQLAHSDMASLVVCVKPATPGACPTGAAQTLVTDNAPGVFGQNLGLVVDRTTMLYNVTFTLDLVAFHYAVGIDMNPNLITELQFDAVFSGCRCRPGAPATPAAAEAGVSVTGSGPDPSPTPTVLPAANVGLVGAVVGGAVGGLVAMGIVVLAAVLIRVRLHSASKKGLLEGSQGQMPRAGATAAPGKGRPSLVPSPTGGPSTELPAASTAALQAGRPSPKPMSPSLRIPNPAGRRTPGTPSAPGHDHDPSVSSLRKARK